MTMRNTPVRNAGRKTILGLSLLMAHAGLTPSVALAAKARKKKGGEPAAAVAAQTIPGAAARPLPTATASQPTATSTMVAQVAPPAPGGAAAAAPVPGRAGGARSDARRARHAPAHGGPRAASRPRPSHAPGGAHAGCTAPWARDAAARGDPARAAGASRLAHL